MLNVTCLPVWSILQALDIKVVDYFSLDIEGNELQVLKTIPFDQVFFKVKKIYIFYFFFLIYPIENMKKLIQPHTKICH